MQPLPPSITQNVLFESADRFSQAATLTNDPAAAGPVVLAGARLAFQGLPSLRMTTSDPSTKQLATQLANAASAALELADAMKAAPAGQDFSGHIEAIQGWAQLAGAAGSAVDLGAPF